MVGVRVLLTGSHLGLTGRTLAPPDPAGEALSEWLCPAPFGLPAHDNGRSGGGHPEMERRLTGPEVTPGTPPG
ncbi:MAG TPA: hypothetical protein VN408_40340 [Actinoplanes sp.]|nr:hypothetical protein [Actinoplanes sp.]